MRRRIGVVIVICLCCVLFAGCFDETPPEPAENQRVFEIYPTSFLNQYAIKIKRCLELEILYSRGMTSEIFSELSLDYVFGEPQIEQAENGVEIYRSTTPLGVTAEIRTVDDRIFWMKFYGDGSAKEVYRLQQEYPYEPLLPMWPEEEVKEYPDAFYYVQAVMDTVEQTDTASWAIAQGIGAQKVGGSGSTKTQRAEYRFKSDKERWVLIVSPV